MITTTDNTLLNKTPSDDSRPPSNPGDLEGREVIHVPSDVEYQEIPAASPYLQTAAKVVTNFFSLIPALIMTATIPLVFAKLLFSDFYTASALRTAIVDAVDAIEPIRSYMWPIYAAARVIQFLVSQIVPTHTMIVDLDQLKDNPTKVLAEFFNSFGNLTYFPRIAFKTSAGMDIGTDAGGITQTAITKMLDAFCQAECTESSRIDTNQGVIPKINSLPKNPSKSEIKSYQSMYKAYEAIGMIFAKTLMSGDPYSTRRFLTGQHFHPVVFEMLQALTDKEIETVLIQETQICKNITLNDFPTIQNKFLKIYLKSEYRSTFGDPNTTKEIIEEGLEKGMDPAEIQQQVAAFEQKIDTAIDDFVDNGTRNDWMEICGIESKEEFIADCNLDETFLAILIIAKSIYQRTIGTCLWYSPAFDTPEKLREKIEGSLTKDQVKKAIILASFLDEEAATNWLEAGFVTRWIENATPEQLKQFLYCTSGSYTLPPEQPIRIWPTTYSAEKDTGRIPIFHTCGFQMDTPMYSTDELFKERLENSMRLIMEGNEGGLA